MDTNIITIDQNQIVQFAEEGNKFIFKPEAEAELIKLLELRNHLDVVIESIKEHIAETGMKLNPNFKGVVGQEVKCIFRKFGAKYNYDWKNKSVCEPFLKRKEYFSVDTDKVEKYIKEVGELPQGIYEAPRDNKLTLSYKEEDEDNKNQKTLE